MAVPVKVFINFLTHFPFQLATTITTLPQPHISVSTKLQHVILNLVYLNYELSPRSSLTAFIHTHFCCFHQMGLVMLNPARIMDIATRMMVRFTVTVHGSTLENGVKYTVSI